MFSSYVPGTGFCGNVERDYLYLRLNTTMYGFQYKVVYGPYRTAG